MSGNPLNAFVSVQFTGGFRVAPMPKLADHIGKGTFQSAIQQHDQAMEQWRTDLERQVNERIQPKDQPNTSLITNTAKLQSTMTGTGATPVVIIPTPPPPPPSGGIIGVGGEDIGGVGGEPIEGV